MSDPKFPDVEVKLLGEDGNAFGIVSKVRKALERAGHRDEAKEFFDEALSGDYDHLLAVVQQYVEVS